MLCVLEQFAAGVSCSNAYSSSVLRALMTSLYFVQHSDGDYDSSSALTCGLGMYFVLHNSHACVLSTAAVLQQCTLLVQVLLTDSILIAVCSATYCA